MRTLFQSYPRPFSDLNVGDPTIRPTAECGYEAAIAANTQDIPEGNVGAGAGATVGKLGGRNRAMKGGVGTALIELPNGLKVAALMAVNAVGDIIAVSYTHLRAHET